MIKDIDYYKDEIHCLYAEKKELQERIDKAIEYIENNGDEIIYSYDKTRELIDKLLDILKGSDKE